MFGAASVFFDSAPTRVFASLSRTASSAVPPVGCVDGWRALIAFASLSNAALSFVSLISSNSFHRSETTLAGLVAVASMSTPFESALSLSAFRSSMSHGEKGATVAMVAAGVFGTAAGLRPRFLGAGVPPFARVVGILVWSACVSYSSSSDILSYPGLASHHTGFACGLCSARFIVARRPSVENRLWTSPWYPPLLFFCGRSSGREERRLLRIRRLS